MNVINIVPKLHRSPWIWHSFIAHLIHTKDLAFVHSGPFSWPSAKFYRTNLHRLVFTHVDIQLSGAVFHSSPVVHYSAQSEILRHWPEVAWPLSWCSCMSHSQTEALCWCQTTLLSHLDLSSLEGNETKRSCHFLLSFWMAWSLLFCSGVKVGKIRWYRTMEYVYFDYPEWLSLPAVKTWPVKQAFNSSKLKLTTGSRRARPVKLKAILCSLILYQQRSLIGLCHYSILCNMRCWSYT